MLGQSIDSLMLHLTFAGLLSTPAPSAAYIGIGFMILFAIMAVVVGPETDSMLLD